MPKTPVKKRNLARTLVASRKNASKKARNRKSSREEIYERRQLVLRYRIKGMTFKQISKELGVGVMTVRRDLQEIKKHNAERVSQFERDEALGDCLQTYELIHQEAWDQYSRAPHGTAQRATFLNLVRAAENDRAKLLMDVGLIGRNAVKVEHSHKADEALQGLTDDAKKLIAMALLKAQLSPPGEPVLEVSGKGNGENRPLLAGDVIDVEEAGDE
jgi:DNA-directed RNA polymerase specialized sigma24 family protein